MIFESNCINIVFYIHKKQFLNEIFFLEKQKQKRTPDRLLYDF